MSKFQEDKEQAALVQQRAENIALFRAWVRKHPEILDCEANLRAFTDYMDFSDPLTEADFEFALSNCRKGRLATRSVAVQVADENERRKAMPVDELRQLARQERPVPQPDALPKFYTPIGKEKEIELTADVLRKAGTRTGDLSTADLKFLIRRYGASKVNERLGYKPRPQVGHSISISDFVGGSAAKEK